MRKTNAQLQEEINKLLDQIGTLKEDINSRDKKLIEFEKLRVNHQILQDARKEDNQKVKDAEVVLLTFKNNLYALSSYIDAQMIAGYDEWNESKIVNRQCKMAHVAVNIWKI